MTKQLTKEQKIYLEDIFKKLWLEQSLTMDESIEEQIKVVNQLLQERYVEQGCRNPLHHNKKAYCPECAPEETTPVKEEYCDCEEYKKGETFLPCPTHDKPQEGKCEWRNDGGFNTVRCIKCNKWKYVTEEDGSPCYGSDTPKPQEKECECTYKTIFPEGLQDRNSATSYKVKEYTCEYCRSTPKPKDENTVLTTEPVSGNYLLIKLEPIQLKELAEQIINHINKTIYGNK